MSKPLVFHPGDWLGDAALRLVSVPARGLWFEMLCLMAFSEKRGHLLLNHQPMPPEKLARVVGATVDEVVAWLKELEAERVFSRSEDGTIYNRRMVREDVKPAAPAPVETEEPLPKNIPPVPYDRIVAAYHEVLPQLTKVQKLTSARRDALRARWREAWEGKGKREKWENVEQGIAHFARYFKFIASNCPFLLGEGEPREGQRPFAADFEWLMKDGNFTKVCEGRYSQTAKAGA
jgi:hypothetical protein